jgi:hypothetical protein
MLVGNITDIESINHEIINNDLYGMFLVQTDSCSGIITNIDTKSLSIFELTLYTDIAKIEIIGSKQEIIINYIDKSNLMQGFETYKLSDYLENTLSKSAYNTLNYAISLIDNNILYTEFSIMQYNINELIFNTQKKLLG